MAIETSRSIVIGDHLLQPLHIFRQAININSSVLNKGYRLRVALHRHQKRQPRLANLPNVALLFRRRSAIKTVAESLTLQLLAH